MIKLDDCKIGRWLHDNPIERGMIGSPSDEVLNWGKNDDRHRNDEDIGKMRVVYQMMLTSDDNGNERR